MFRVGSEGGIDVIMLGPIITNFLVVHQVGERL
jgi:hypothetical protein